jgi:predicted dehydrogenase
MSRKLINTALCSFGMSGQVFHAPFISENANFNFYGVLERTKNLAEKLYPKVKTFRTLDHLLSDKAIELIIVNTPSVTHFEIAKQVIKAGKHLIVEKPFTASVNEAQELIDLAAKNNVLLSVYHNRRFDSDFKTVKSIVNEQWLGTIIDVEIHYDRYVPALSYKAHKEKPTPATGSLYDLGSHIIDQAIVLFGLPNAVFANLQIFRPNSKVHDYFDVKLYYANHTVTLKSSYFVKEVLPAYIFHGSHGSFIKSRADVQESALQKSPNLSSDDWGVEPISEQGLLHGIKNEEVIKKHVPTLKGNYMEYYNKIYEAIKQQKDLPVTGTDGLNVIKVIEAALQSNRTKKMITL